MEEQESSWNLLVNLVKPWPIVTQSGRDDLVSDQSTRKWLFTIRWILRTILVVSSRRRFEIIVVYYVKTS